MKKIAYLLLFSCLILFQSCFEIIEQVFLKNDGSGDFRLTVNLSKSKTKLNSIVKMKTINGYKIPSKEDIKVKIAEIEKNISKNDGITNVKTTIDFDNYIATLSCNFNKIKQINNVIKNLDDKKGNNKAEIPNFFSYDLNSNIFTRHANFSVKDDYDKLSTADKEVLAAANYTTIYKFESNIIKASNTQSIPSPSRKAIMLKQSVLEVVKNKNAIENKINLTKE